MTTVNIQNEFNKGKIIKMLTGCLQHRHNYSLKNTESYKLKQRILATLNIFVQQSDIIQEIPYNFSDWFYWMTSMLKLIT